MVKLTKIYTRGGDGGETSLGNGDRVSKYDARVSAYGDVDETNSVIGIARLHTADAPEMDAILARIQHDLFDLGADLCTPEGDSEREATALRITPAQVDRLEAEIDAANEKLQPLNSFVLPGGSALAAHLHLARTVSRRAERHVAALAASESINRAACHYINRLSDHLFVYARLANNDGRADVLWKPGATR